MKKERRGGSRLEKNNSKRDRQAQPQTGAASPGEKRRGGFPRWAKILLIILAFLAAVVLILFAVYKSWAKLPTQPTQPPEITADPDGNLLPQNVMANTPRKDGFYTFLVVGRDTGGGGNTDTMMLAAYDIPHQKLSVMSLPRDTMVDARHPDRNRKLNGVWNLGLYYAKKDEKKEGIEYLKEAVGDMLGFVPDFYVVINWEAFGRLVDAIGGVEFEVPFDMNYKDPTQDLYINVPKGKRVLSGEEAMGVVRWRHNNSFSVGYATGDLGRIQTQQALMKEVVRKCLQIDKMTRINEFAKIFSEEVDTDLTLGNLAAFAERAIFGGLKMDNVIFTTMPNTGVNVKGESYVQANPEELLGLLNDSFNPYKEDLPMEALHILQYSSSKGYYVYSGTGTGTSPVYTETKPAQVVTKPEPTPASQEPVEQDSEAVDSDAPAPDAGSGPSGAPDGSSAVESPSPDVRPGGGEDDPSPGAASSDSPSEPPADTSEESAPSDSEPETSAPSADPSAEPSTAPVPEGQPAGIPMD